MIRIAAFLMLLFAAPMVSSAAENVTYQLKDWKAKHMHDTKKADKIIDTLKKLGCEVERHQHGNHYDVKYRCPKARKLELKTHKEALAWEKWLKEYGFVTKHTH